MTELPDFPEHIHKIQPSGQITIPKELRDQFTGDKFVVFADDDGDMIHLYPTEKQ